MAKEILEVGDWIQYIAINGQTQHGKVDSLVEDMNEKETRVDLKLLNGQKDSIWINDEWVKAHPNASSLLDEKYNERNKQSNDLQQRKRNDTVNHPSHYNYGEIETIDYCDQVCKQYPPELAPYVFNAIKYLSRANHKNGREDIDKAKF
ncbi:DUF3310 domain-containing protein [Staphylococcus xylosus]